MRHFVCGSDWWTDCDDAVAMRLLARASKRGEIKLECVGINACMEASFASLVSFFHLEGIDNLAIGLDREATDFGGHPPYQKRLAQRCESNITNEDAPDAALLYRKVLREAEEPVEIIEIGFPQVLNTVLEREPELFAEKVAHIWMMAGRWDTLPGVENNFARNARSRRAAAAFCRNCPVPITFLGFEVSYDILVGGKLAPNDHLKQVLIDHGSPDGRCAWDPMLVQLALTGDPEQAGYGCVYGTASVDPETGENRFVRHAHGKHRFVVKMHENNFYQNEIDRAIALE